MSLAHRLDGVELVGDEVLPAARAELGDAQDPLRVELRALVDLEEVHAIDAIALGQPHQPAFRGDQALVDVVELLDQGVDARLVERQGLHVGDDLVLELLVLAVLRGRERRVLQPVLDVDVLQAAQLLVVVGDAVEGFEHLRLQLGLHGRERHVVLHVVLVQLRVHRRQGVLVGHRRPAARCGDRLALGRGHDWRVLAVGAGIGRLEVDDVAQQDLALVELVAPDDDRLEGEGAFAEPGDHRLAAGLDALGDGDLALAGEELDRAHLAQVHAHRDRRCGRSAPSSVSARAGVRGAAASTRSPPSASSSSAASGLLLGSSSVSASSLSTTLMPISENMPSTSSIWSRIDLLGGQDVVDLAHA